MCFISMYSVLNTFSEYAYFDIKKILLHTLLFLVFKIVESLQCILQICLSSYLFCSYFMRILNWKDKCFLSTKSFLDYCPPPRLNYQLEICPPDNAHLWQLLHGQLPAIINGPRTINPQAIPRYSYPHDSFGIFSILVESF